MPSAPIKYSDLIVPDDSIDKLTAKLQGLQQTYTTMMSDMIAKAKELKATLTGASGATSSGRTTITSGAAQVDALQKAQERLTQAMSENAKSIAKLNQLTKEQNQENAIAARLATSLNGSYNSLSAQLAQLKMQYNALSAAERDAAGGKDMQQQIVAISAQLKEYNATLSQQIKLKQASQKWLQSESGSYDELTAKLTQLKAAYQALSAENRRGSYGQGLAKQIASATAQIKSYNKALSEQTKLEQLRTQEAESAEGSYNRLSATYQRLKIEINAMGEADEKEAMSKRQLEQEAKRVYEQMIKLQEATGKHTLSVGNYAKSWDGLRFSVFQVVREMPNAAISLNTLFLALSNNIPIVADEIARVSRENKEAIAYNKENAAAIQQGVLQAKPAVGVLKQLVGALFSFNTVLILVIAAFTMFGDKIVAFIKQLFTGKKEIKSLGEALHDVNDELKKDTKQVGQNIAEYKKLQLEWNKLRTTKEKNQFIKDNTSEFDKLGIAVNNVSEAEERFVSKTADVIKALTLRAKAAAAQKLAAEQYEDVVKAQIEYDEKYTTIDKKTGQRVLKEKYRGEAKSIELAPMVSPTTGVYAGYSRYTVNDAMVAKNARDEISRMEKNANAYMELSERLTEQANELAGKPTKNKNNPKGRTPRDITMSINEMIRNINQALSESATAISGSGFNHDIDVINDTLTKALNKMDSANDKIDNWLNNPKKFKLTKEQREALEGLKDKIALIRANAYTLAQVQGNEAELTRTAQDNAFDLRIEQTDQQDVVGKGLSAMYTSRMQIIRANEAAELSQLQADYKLRQDLIDQGDKDELEKLKKYYKEAIAIRNRYQRQEVNATAEYNQSLREHNAEIGRIQSDAQYARQGGDRNAWWGDAIQRRYRQQRGDIYTQLNNANNLTPEQIQKLNAQLDLLNGQEQQEMNEHGYDIFDMMGLKLSDGKKNSINETLSFVGDAFNSLMELEAAYTQRAIENAQKRVDATRNALTIEMEARANGYANNVEYAQKEYDNAKKMQQKALDRQKKVQKAQLAINAAEQVSNLVTATSKTWAEWGSPWAIPFIALMWTSWAASKIMALKAVDMQNESTEYGQGGYELLQGGSHQSGNDIDLGRTQDGRKRRAEGGEFFAIINKKSSRRYRKQIPQVINALNDGTFERRYMRASEAEMGLGKVLSAYDKADGITLKAEARNSDLRQLQSDVRQIKEQGEKRTMFDSNGNEVIYYKNLRRVITRA